MTFLFWSFDLFPSCTIWQFWQKYRISYIIISTLYSIHTVYILRGRSTPPRPVSNKNIFVLWSIKCPNCKLFGGPSRKVILWQKVFSYKSSIKCSIWPLGIFWSLESAVDAKCEKSFKLFVCLTSHFKVDSNMKLGEWAGLCKIDQEGKARKVVKCSCAVVRNWGTETPAHHVLQVYMLLFFSLTWNKALSLPPSPLSWWPPDGW